MLGINNHPGDLMEDLKMNQKCDKAVKEKVEMYRKRMASYFDLSYLKLSGIKCCRYLTNTKKDTVDVNMSVMHSYFCNFLRLT